MPCWWTALLSLAKVFAKPSKALRVLPKTWSRNDIKPAKVPLVTPVSAEGLP